MGEAKRHRWLRRDDCGGRVRVTATALGLLTLPTLAGCGDKVTELREKVAQLLGGEAVGASQGERAASPTPLPTALPPLERAMQALRERGVDTSGGVVQRGGDLRLTYETASASEYDDKLLVVWATAFGALGRLAKSKVTIVNTVGGRPVVEVSASTHDIRGMLDGAMKTRDFMQRLRVVSVERHSEVVLEADSAGDPGGNQAPAGRAARAAPSRPAATPAVAARRRVEPRRRADRHRAR